MRAEDVDQAGRRRFLLGDRDVDADDALALLVEDRVDGDGGLARLAVADDQLALAAADRRHGVDRLDPGLHRLVDRLAVGDPGGGRLDQSVELGDDRALVVDRLAQRVDHPADQRLADRDAEELAGRGDRLAFVDVGVFAEDDHADRRLFEVERQTLDAVLELDHLAGHHAREAVDPRDAVADLEHAADLGPRDLGLELLDLTLNNRSDLVGSEFHGRVKLFLVGWFGGFVPLYGIRLNGIGSRAPADARFKHSKPKNSCRDHGERRRFPVCCILHLEIFNAGPALAIGDYSSRFGIRPQQPPR